MIRIITLLFLYAVAAALASPAASQSSPPPLARSDGTSCWIVPTWRTVVDPSAFKHMQVDASEIRVSIDGPIASTRLSFVVHNTTAAPAQAEILVPLPKGAVVKTFVASENGKPLPVAIYGADEARRIYESIVARSRDPGLLEFVRLGLAKASVFPVPAQGSQRFEIVYEQTLEREADRFEYVLPRSESLSVQHSLDIEVEISSASPIGLVYSPSHEIATTSRSPHTAKITLSPNSKMTAGPFRLSFGELRGDLSTGFWAFPNRKGDGGWFSLALSLPEAMNVGRARLARELTLVIDRSGSMKDGKLEQVVEAAKQVIAGLRPNDSFNVIAYSDKTSKLFDGPTFAGKSSIADATAFLDTLRPSGGTNIHEALREALAQPAAEGVLPLVLFLTDGLPTVGRTDEASIRNVVEEANPHGRRVFAFGVGLDVNTPLLDRLAVASRATATFVLPGENVEVKIARVAERLEGPLIERPVLEVVEAGRVVKTRVFDICTPVLPDFYGGDQIMVFGRYAGSDPIDFRLSGRGADGERSWQIRVHPKQASVERAWVARIWASRRIAALTYEIRQSAPLSGGSVAFGAEARDARFKELVDEVVALSREFGILTEYTAFLAAPGADTAAAIHEKASENFVDRAWNARSGAAGYNQDANLQTWRAQSCLNPSNNFQDASLQVVEFRAVEQRADLAFFNRNGRWVDSRLLESGTEPAPARTVDVGSKEHSELLSRHVAMNRQSCLALEGEILLDVDGEVVLVRTSTP